MILTLMLISPKMTTREMIPNAFIRYFYFLSNTALFFLTNKICFWQSRFDSNALITIITV